MPDLRHAFRQLGRAPGFTAVAVITLALGIGANAVFFSTLYGVVLAQPPFPDAARLVSLHNTTGGAVANGTRLSRAEVREYAERQRAFAEVAAADLGRMTLTSADPADGFAERVKVSRVTPNLFATLGIAPSRGRGPRTAHAQGTPAAVISHELWTVRLGSAADVLQKSVRLNGVQYAIVGVMPAGFAYPEPGMAAWLPLDLAPRDASDRTDHYLAAIARLAPGVSTADARADLQRVARQLQQDLPEAYPADRGQSIDLVSLRQRHYGDLLLPLGTLMAAAAAVLLIACVNVAIMSLLRALERRREMAIRLSLGAARRTVVAQLVTEAAVLCAVGAAAGLALSTVGLDLLKAIAPPGVPRLEAVEIDAAAALFTAAILVVVTLVVGLAPAFVASRMKAFEGVVTTNRSSDSRGATRLRDALTVMEITLATALVIGAGLTLRSLRAMTQVDMGFTTERVVSFKTNLTADAYPNAARVEQFYAQLSARLEAMPGTTATGAVSYVPLSNEGLSLAVRPAEAAPGSGRSVEIGWRLVRGHYFEAMGVELVAGRLFEGSDRANTPAVVVVDDVLARRLWGSEAAALGQRLGAENATPQEMRTVVGVVRHVNEVGPNRASLPTVYGPQSQANQRGMYTVIRTRAAPGDVMAGAREAVAAVDPSVPLYFAETMAARYDASLALPRFTAGLIGAFSTIALLLAGVGVFGVTAYAVRQRLREFGIRLALGAQRANICTLVLLRVAALAALGLALGSGIGSYLGALMAGLLFGIGPADLPSMALAVLAISVTAIAASVVPLRRAVSVRLAEILRAE